MTRSTPPPVVRGQKLFSLSKSEASSNLNMKERAGLFINITDMRLSASYKYKQIDVKGRTNIELYRKVFIIEHSYILQS